MTQVEHVATRIVELELPKPVGTAIHRMRSVGCVLVDVRTTDGVVGQGYLFALNGDRAKSLDEQIIGLATTLQGRSIFESEGIWHDLWGRINAMGHKGVTISAMSALDVAIWDAVGKTLDQPLHRLWGACRDEVPTYATSGLWLSQSVDELVAEAASFVETGFVAMKIRLGSERPADDVARVAAVREAIGPGVELLSDVNQGLTPKAAIRLGRMLEPYDLGWIEEPVPAYDLDGHARVRDALDTPIASGETEYTRHGMQAMLRAGACDVLMPDLQRIGGYSEFRKADAIASAWNVPTSSHFFTEQSLALAGSLANLISVEHCDWFAPLFNESMELRGGKLVVPERPGTGFTFAR
ncbi:MAG: mandelate racemase/muconate lactonizing enzyme family protein [Actinomycetota bacterium]